MNAPISGFRLYWALAGMKSAFVVESWDYWFYINQIIGYPEGAD